MLDLLAGATDLLSGTIYKPSCSWHSHLHVLKAFTKCHHLRTYPQKNVWPDPLHALDFKFVHSVVGHNFKS